VICGILRRTDDLEESRMRKKYVVKLAKEQRERLLKLASAGIAPARMLTRARILLKADTGGHAGGGPALSDGQVAEMLETSTATVGRVRERFCRQGLDAALERSMPDRVQALARRACRGTPDRASLLGAPREARQLEHTPLGGQGGGVGDRREGLARDGQEDAQKTSCVPTSSRGG